MKSIFTLSTSPASRISTHQMSSHRKTIFPASWKTIHKRIQISLSVPMDTIYEHVLGALPRVCLFQKILAKLCVHTSGTQYANGLQSAYPMQSTSCLPFNSFSFKNGKLHSRPRTPGVYTNPGRMCFVAKLVPLKFRSDRKWKQKRRASPSSGCNMIYHFILSRLSPSPF